MYMPHSSDHRDPHRVIRHGTAPDLSTVDHFFANRSLVDSLYSVESLRYEIRGLVSKITNNEDDASSASIRFYRLAHSDGATSVVYHGALFQELLLLNREALAHARVDGEPSALLHFLVANDRIALRYPHHLTTPEEDASWAGVIAQHLSFLSLSKTWGTNHSAHLDFTATLIQGILFCHTHAISLDAHRSGLMHNALDHLISAAPKLILTDAPTIEAVKDVRLLVRLAEQWNNPMFRSGLHSLFEAVNELCQQLDPERFSATQHVYEGGEIGFRLDDRFDHDYEFTDEEDECRFFENLCDERHEKELEGRYVRRIPGDELIFHDEDIRDHLALLHADILIAMRTIPFDSQREAALFFFDVLRDNSHLMPNWEIALDGLTCISPAHVLQFIPQLISLAVEEPAAVKHVLHLMSAKERLGAACEVDFSDHVIDQVRRMHRKSQDLIIEHGRELFEDEFEYVVGSERSQRHLEMLAARIQPPSS